MVRVFNRAGLSTTYRSAGSPSTWSPLRHRGHGLELGRQRHLMHGRHRGGQRPWGFPSSAPHPVGSWGGRGVGLLAGPLQFCYQNTSFPAVGWAGFAPSTAPLAYYLLMVGPTKDSYTYGYTYVYHPAAAAEIRCNIPDGATFYVTVRTVSQAGLSSGSVYTGAVLKDSSAPLCGALQEAANWTSQTASTRALVGTTADPHSGLAALEVALALTADPWASDGNASLLVVPWRTLSASQTEYTFTGLSLGPGTYYTIIRAYNKARLQCRRASGGVVVDLTAPQVDTDVLAMPRYMGSARTLALGWDGAAWDTESGIDTYAWSLAATPGGSALGQATWAGTLTAGNLTVTSNLIHNTAYYLKFVARNRAGLSSTVGPNPILVDLTAPVFGPGGAVALVADLPGGRYYTERHTLTVAWSGFTDPESGIAGYVAAIYRMPDAAGAAPVLVTSERLANGTLAQWTFVGLALAEPADHFVRVTALNGAGLTVAAQTATFRVTTLSPREGLVYDGCRAAPQIGQPETDHLCALWVGLDSADPQNPVVSLRYWARHVASGDLVANGTLYSDPTGDTVQPTSCRIEGLALTVGERYNVTVEAVLASGLANRATSAGIVIDQSPPQAGAANMTHQAFVARGTPLLVLTAGWADPESTVVGYEYAIYRAAAPWGLAVPFTAAGRWTSIWVATWPLEAGLYTVSLRATNGAGLTAAINGTASFSLCEEAPIAPAAARLWLGAGCADGIHRRYQTDRTALGLCWTGMQPSPYGGALSYHLALRRNGLAAPFVTRVLDPPAEALNLTGLGLAGGDSIVATLVGLNEAALGTTLVSLPLVIDAGVPLVNYLKDGLAPAATGEYTDRLNVSAVWSITCPSGVVDYRVQVRLGSCEGPALTGWTTLPGTATAYTWPLAEASHDPARAEALVVALEATSNVGFSVAACTAGCRYDGAPPTGGSVRVLGSAPSADLAQLAWPAAPIEQNLPDAFPRLPSQAFPALPATGQRCLTVAWEGFEDGQSGVGQVLLVVGSTPGERDLAGPLDVHLLSPATICGLPAGQPLFVSACARDNAGQETCVKAPYGVSLIPPARPMLAAVEGRTPTSPLACEALAADGAAWSCAGLAAGLPLTGTGTWNNGSLSLHLALSPAVEGLCAVQVWAGRNREASDLLSPLEVALDPAATGPAVDLAVPLSSTLSAVHVAVRTWSCLRAAAHASLVVYLTRATPGPAPGDLTLAVAPADGALEVAWPAVSAPAQVPVRVLRWSVAPLDAPADPVASGTLAANATGVRIPGEALTAGSAYNTRAPHLTPLLRFAPAGGGGAQFMLETHSTAPDNVGHAARGFRYDRTAPALEGRAWIEAPPSINSAEAQFDNRDAFNALICAQWNATDPESAVARVVVVFVARSYDWSGGSPGGEVGRWDSATAVNGTAARRACVGPRHLFNPLFYATGWYDVNITATNGAGLATTLVLTNATRFLRPGMGSVHTGCPNGTAPGPDGARLQNHTTVCANWSGFEPPLRYAVTDAAALARDLPQQYAVEVATSPDGPALLTATLGASARSVALDGAGRLRDGDTYWVRVTARNGNGWERTGVSGSGVTIAARGPALAGLEGSWVCLDGAGDAVSALRSASGCGTGDALAYPTTALKVAFTEGLGLSLAQAQLTVRAAGEAAAVVAAQTVPLYAPGTTVGAGPATEYTLLYDLSGPQAALLRCGTLYQVELTVTSALGVSSATSTSGPFELCAHFNVTAAYSAVLDQVEGTFYLSGTRHWSASLALECLYPGAVATVTPTGWLGLAGLTGSPLNTGVKVAPGGRYALPMGPLTAAKRDGMTCTAALKATFYPAVPSGAFPELTSALVRSAPFLYDASAPALRGACRFAEGQWWPDSSPGALPLLCNFTATDPDSGIASITWALGTRPNTTDLLPFTACPLANRTATAALGACVAPAALATQILQNRTLESVWVAAVAANGVGLQAWTAAWLRVERTEPGLREAWLECAPEAAGGWVAAVGWRELFDMQSGVANLTVALFDGPTGAALGQVVLPNLSGAVGTPAQLAARSPDPTGRVTFPISGPAPGGALCPYSALLTACDRAGRCVARAAASSSS
ncbi:putative DNA double-strand break repair Rad50 ATPase [Paratrimastix pyriformis]|uniref:DNA double-strand break repair Rad50 ATPase n=1 Tax=Paratrimastix pyriformis TaxID=342808 RepID=A0ABQ8UHA0_9EUKA|nr:putative DNA double-strand break repair Rad50 ATPase [Paratrimastix pyriformis]